MCAAKARGKYRSQRARSSYHTASYVIDLSAPELQGCLVARICAFQPCPSRCSIYVAGDRPFLPCNLQFMSLCDFLILHFLFLHERHLLFCGRESRACLDLSPPSIMATKPVPPTNFSPALLALLLPRKMRLFRVRRGMEQI